LGAGLGALVVYLAVALAVAPSTAQSLLLRGRYGAEVELRQRQGQRLGNLTRELTALEARVGELRDDLERVYLTYGLDPATSDVGQGGYPLVARYVSESIFTAAVRRTAGLEGRLVQELAVLDTFLDELRSFEAANADRAATTPSRSPLRGEFVLTSPFGTRRSPFTQQWDFHPGLDLAASQGSPIHAPAEGVVVYAGRYPLKQSVAWWRYGNLVALRHGDGFITLFGHCEEVLVRSGQSVAQGDVLATVGSTGWSTRPHLHYEIRWRDGAGKFEPVDPRIYILDHRWKDEEIQLVRGRGAPGFDTFEPLPRVIGER
jgi:murein DD-endopeptidase MepM/ murein hydrolase activator NlpD